jgi:hypothetical protein
MIRDRIQDLRRVRAGDLKPSPKNWRRHPEVQRRAMQAALAEIGFADALLVRETDGGLELIDGHLRADLDPEQTVPVLVLDVDEQEAGKLLATLDPLAGMAEADLEALKLLAADLDFQMPDLEMVVTDLVGPGGIEGWSRTCRPTRRRTRSRSQATSGCWVTTACSAGTRPSGTMSSG